MIDSFLAELGAGADRDFPPEPLYRFVAAMQGIIVHAIHGARWNSGAACTTLGDIVMHWYDKISSYCARSDADSGGYHIERCKILLAALCYVTARNNLSKSFLKYLVATVTQQPALDL